MVQKGNILLVTNDADRNELHEFEENPKVNKVYGSINFKLI